MNCEVSKVHATRSRGVWGVLDTGVSASRFDDARAAFKREYVSIVLR